MENHQEKQCIFDAYAKAKVFISWMHLVNSCNNYELLNHTFAACDLVQEEQQKRISEKEETISGDDFYFSGVPVDKIINPENKIQ
ncbi:hypothetical protein [Chryseobacterium sp. HR92]|uniref:hypothetical protein n=1 Tax=Chryseobacterium sp. HR92 TaxID=3094839 RepID=UPI00388F665A|nr:hypothetical protein SFA27_16870 [Chryseobacterium sp. HR92]